MSHELLRLTEKICNTPLLVSETYLDKVVNLLEKRNSGIGLATIDKIQPRRRSLDYFADRQLGVVAIHGGITDVPYQAMCEEEAVSHQLIREEVEQLIAAGAKTIVLDQASSGGTAHMAFESANYIRQLADDNDVKLIGYVSSHSYSASYVYSAVVHELITNPSAEMGSIGVRVMLRNTNGYMQKLGIEDIYITAGEGKVPFDSEGKFTKDFLDEVQESVTEVYDQFTDHVAMWRGLEKDKVVALGAKTYSSKKSLEHGLVDKVMTLEEFKSYLDSLNGGEGMSNPTTNILTSKQSKGTEMSEKNNEVEASAEFDKKLADLEAKFTAMLSAKDQELAQLASTLKDKELAEASAKSAARLAQLTAAIGTEKAPALATTLEALDDKAFELVVSEMKAARLSTDEDEGGDEGEDIDGNEETLSLDERTALDLKKLYANKR